MLRFGVLCVLLVFVMVLSAIPCLFELYARCCVFGSLLCVLCLWHMHFHLCPLGICRWCDGLFYFDGVFMCVALCCACVALVFWWLFVLDLLLLVV